MDAKKILVVDDSANDVELLLEAFADHQLADEVVVARDGAEALDYPHCRGAFATRPTGNPLMLLDLKMPRVGGLDVLREIKTAAQLKLLPVVVMTSSREEHDIVEAYRLGVNAYVVKPVEFAPFIDAVKSLSLFWVRFNQPPPG